MGMSELKALKKVLENPKLKAESDYIEIFFRDDNLIIENKENEEKIKLVITNGYPAKYNMKIIHPEIDIAEAMEAYVDGKTIRSVSSDKEYGLYVYDPIGKASKIELRGKWTIKE